MDKNYASGWNELTTKNSWMLFKIMGEFVEGFEKMGLHNPCISIFGSALIFVSVFCAAMFNIFSRKVSKLMYPSEITFLMMLVGFVFFMSWYLISLLLSNNINDFFLPFKNINSTLAILYLGFVASILGFFLVNHNLKHFPAHVSSIFANIATIVSILAGVIFLGERIYLHHIIGSIMIMIGVYGVVSNNKNRNKSFNLI